MAENEALGFVETRGLVAAIEAADAMVKAARVRIKTVGNADAALISVICEGDLAACAAAVDAGKAAFAIKAIADECGEDDRMTGERVHELINDILGDPDVRFSFFTVNAFAKAVMEVANETKKKIWGDTSQDEVLGTGSTF